MARKFLTALDLAKNELQNAAVQNLAAAPSAPVKGQLYFDSTGNLLYWWDGTTWQSAKGGSGSPTGAAGGDLSGTYPNPTVVKSNGDFTVGGDALLPAAGSQIAFAAAASGVGRIQMPATGTTGADGITWGAYVPGSTGVAIHRKASDYLLIDAFLLEVNCQLDMKTHNISGVSTPVAADHAANKSYVDGLINGLSWKAAVQVATTANITLSGLAMIDNYTPLTGDRVLVKDQTAQAQNGIYVAASGAWARSTDMDVAAEVPNATVYVASGTAQGDTAWAVTNPSAALGFTLGTNPIVWGQIGGPGSVTAGAGMTQSGNTLNVIAGDSTLTVAADSIVVNTTTLDARYALAAAGAKRIALPLPATVSSLVPHNFGTRDVIVDVYRVASPYDTVECDIERTDANNVTVRFAVAPAAGEYRAVIMA